MKSELALETENRIVNARRKAYDKKIGASDGIRERARVTTNAYRRGWDEAFGKQEKTDEERLSLEVSPQNKDRRRDMDTPVK